MSYVQITMDELMFFDKEPEVLPLYEALRYKLLTAHSDVRTKVDKTQISFRNRCIFAGASMQRITGALKNYLLVTFGLDHRNTSPRINVSVEAVPIRWTHHVVVTQEEELDAELLSWIDDAYQFSAAKRRKAGHQ